MIRVLVVEDTPTVRDFLVAILERDPEIRVVGTAANGELALKAVLETRPDIVTMDVQMPKMNGLEATRLIMENHPVPIIIVSAIVVSPESKRIFDAMNVGALAILKLPSGIGSEEFEETAAELILNVKLMSQVKVVKRWRSTRHHTHSLQKFEDKRLSPSKTYNVVVIGASTGGPLVVQNILRELPKNFPVPIFVAQHMSHGFMDDFVDWLKAESKLPVHMARHMQTAEAGHVYCAPDTDHLAILPGLKMALDRESSPNVPYPSITHLFQSAAQSCGAQGIGILLTGMGKDGSEGMKSMYTRGAVTIAQDKESSVIYGMPKEVVDAGVVRFVLNPEQIVQKLMNLFGYGDL